MQQAEERAERTVGLIRMAIAISLGVVFVVTLSAAKPVEQLVLNRQMLFAGGSMLSYFLLGLASVSIVTGGLYRPWMAWVAATGDGAFLLINIWTSLLNTGLSANFLILFPPLWLAPVVLSFGALRFNPRLQAYLIMLLATGLVATAYLGAYEVFRQPEPLPEVANLFVSIPADVMRLTMLCLAGMVLVIASIRSRSVVSQAISETVRGTNLTRYLPRQIADRLAETGLDELRRGRRQNVAVLFTDIRGFTEMSEPLAPEELGAFVSGFRIRIARAADATGGTIDKFVGDAAMIVFGLAGSHDNDAVAALRCADQILLEMQNWSDERMQSGDPAVRVGIGIHHGEVFCGAIGDETRLEYTVLGDTVNVAARLEELTKSVGMPIVVSMDLLEHAGSGASGKEWQTVETTHLRGRTGEITVMASPGRQACRDPDSGKTGRVLLRPSPAQAVAFARETLFQLLTGFNAVDAKMAEVVAQLAPGGKNRAVDIKDHCDRPDDALGRSPLFIVIVQMQLAFGADRIADRALVDRRTGHRMPLRDEELRSAQHLS